MILKLKTADHYTQYDNKTQIFNKMDNFKISNWKSSKVALLLQLGLMDSSTFEVQILPSYRLGKVKILYHLAFHLFRISILMDAQPFYIWYKNKIHLKEPIEMTRMTEGAT